MIEVVEEVEADTEAVEVVTVEADITEEVAKGRMATITTPTIEEEVSIEVGVTTKITEVVTSTLHMATEEEGRTLLATLHQQVIQPSIYRRKRNPRTRKTSSDGPDLLSKLSREATHLQYTIIRNNE